ncbi:MAG: M28 family peptidase [Pirellulales bacterium]|nr:M28 family peptidase [Pirellulales bacterium]
MTSAFNTNAGRRLLATLLVFASLFLAVGGQVTGLAAQDATSAVGDDAPQDSAAAMQRMTSDIFELASDKYEGRGPGTAGIDLAAEYIAKRFGDLGLKIDSYDDTPFQHFELPAGATVGETNHAVISGPGDASIELVLSESFTPLALGGSAKFDMPIAFVGYGITAPDLEYDDYAGMDVRGKAVIILQGEPQTNDNDSKFNGRRDTVHARDSRKISNAYQHGAEAVILIPNAAGIQSNLTRSTRTYERALERVTSANAAFQEIENPTVEQIREYQEEIESLTGRAVRAAERLVGMGDPLVPFSTRRRGRGGNAEGRNLPIISIKRSIANQLLTSAGKPSLEASETKIDETLSPNSFVLEESNISGEVSVKREIYDVKNVVGVLPATEDGPLAKETLIIGAHYDHLGYGRGATSGRATEIHNGADDNGSGTTGVLELARRFSQMKTRRRRVVFILFSAEERGLIGSAFHANNPLFPLEDTIAMMNLDMIGRLRENQLTIRGTGTAKEFDELIDELNATYRFEINKDPAGQGPSDHASFYRKDMPVLDMFTNTHDDYHRPTDEPDTVNVDGMLRIVAMTEELCVGLMNRETRLTFTSSEAQTQESSAQANAGTLGGNNGRATTNEATDESRPWFGAIPNFAGQVEGVKLTGASKHSPAEKAGLKEGDVIVELGGNRIGTLEDLDGALRKFKIGDKVRVVAMRGERKLVLEVELDIRPVDGQ